MAKEDQKDATTEVAPATNPVGYMLNLGADLGNGRQLQITGNLPTGATREQFDTELDKLCGAIGRKQDEATIPALEARIDQATAQLEAQKKDRLRIANSYEGKNQPVQEGRDLQVADNAIDSLTKQIERDTKLLVKTKQSVEGAAKK